MKKLLHPIFAALLCLCLLNACKKGYSDQQSALPDPQAPDLTTQASINVSGFVTNENGEAVYNALVTAGTKSVTTDNYGYFKFTNVSLSKTAPFVSVSKEGYFNSYRTFVSKSTEETFTRIKLVPKTNAGTIDASAGGTVTTTDGGSVSLPANAVVNAVTNAAYTGTVHVAAHLFKQSDATEFSTTAPGDNRGITNDGYLQIRQSYGMLAVELTGDAGELLQIAPGKEATISTPIPAALVALAPNSIPLWSFDIAKGLWKEESSTIKNGSKYVGNVSHFSFWDGAVGMPLVNLTVQIVNSALKPLGNVFVLIRRADDPSIGTASYTNNDGIVSGAVPANTSLKFEVYNICNGPVLALSQNIITTTNNIDLGTITADLGEQLTLTGTVVNCNNQPVTNGYILLTSKITVNSTTGYRIPVTNGSFNFSTALCANISSSYVVIDDDADQQGDPQAITLVAGINNLGTLTACGTSTNSVINYRVDGGPWINLTEPTDTMMGTYHYNNGLNSGGSIITAGALQNLNPDMQFSYFGLNTLGNDHTVVDIWSVSFIGPAHRCTATTPLTLTFTEFGELGGFIAGSFSGNVEDFTDHSPHTIECNFRVRRVN